MILIRSGVDLIAPTSGPFAMTYPAVLIATLFGHAAGGLTAWCVAFLWAWYFVLPFPRSFEFEMDTDGARVLINALCGLVVIGLAEAFRRAVRLSTTQLAQDAERRLHLLAELEHRTKNNFALVASLLEIQRRRHTDPELVGALEDAGRRVMTFADAYSNLADEQAEGAEVEAKPYLERLAARLGSASFPNNVQLTYRIDPMVLPREVGVAIGLYLNEALANCAKYAFPDDRAGHVNVRFDSLPDGWRLSVEDDGIGDKPHHWPHSTGLGRQLMQAFAHQAGADHSLDIHEGGCSATLTKRNQD